MRYFFISFFLTINLLSQESYRIWTDINGRTVKARFIKVHERYVVIERESDKRRMSFPIDQLSPSDRSKIPNNNAKRTKSKNSKDYQGILLREKKWTNRVGGSLQRFFFAFKLDKIDADRDGFPEGNKVIVQQLWHGGRESFTKVEIIMEQACTGSWTVDDSGTLEINWGKCYPDRNARLGFYSGGPTTDLSYWKGAGYSPRTICDNKRAHPHTSSCGCPFQGAGIWRYNESSKSFQGTTGNDNWRASIYPLLTALESK